eukprot:Sspe_Gene.102520::Locus_78099_Transcript_1_2_Confidence_0.833_Length_579::g.102520::m.102520/K03105/SRP19; signal recognition particle subunit SRP19
MATSSAASSSAPAPGGRQLPQDLKTYQIFYPQYIDKDLTISQGRRVPKERGVEKPLSIEIYQACAKLNLPVVLQPEKGYARQSTDRRGRVAVLVKRPRPEGDESSDRELVNPEIPNKDTLFRKVAEIIPGLPMRQKQPEPTITTDKKAKKKKK